MSNPPPPKLVLIAVFDKVTCLDFVGPAQIFGACRNPTPLFEVRTLSLHSGRNAVISDGYGINATYTPEVGSQRRCHSPPSQVAVHFARPNMQQA